MTSVFEVLTFTYILFLALKRYIKNIHSLIISSDHTSSRRRTHDNKHNTISNKFAQVLLRILIQNMVWYRTIMIMDFSHSKYYDIYCIKCCEPWWLTWWWHCKNIQFKIIAIEKSNLNKVNKLKKLASILPK